MLNYDQALDWFIIDLHVATAHPSVLGFMIYALLA